MGNPNFNVTGNDVGEPGSLAVWAKVDPESFRMLAARSPRTTNLIGGLFFQLQGTREEVWMVTREGVRRAEPWLRLLYNRTRDAELAEGSQDRIPPEDMSGAEVGQI